MLTKLNYTVSTELLQEAAEQSPLLEFIWNLNQPTGRFFYDPWVIKQEYTGTVWEKLLQALPFAIGEARLIGLSPATSYHMHADLDDRYHLNVTGESCYLFDFDNKEMHPIQADGIWYEMDAGRLHSAGNFGRICRSQLVVRKLLNQPTLNNPVSVRITSTISNKDDARFLFDNSISILLNQINKLQALTNFKFSETEVTFMLEESMVNSLTNNLPKGFQIELL